MDKSNEVVNMISSKISLVDRKIIELTGVKKLVSFDPEEFLIETVFGAAVLKGDKLDIIKLDVKDGFLSIKGKIDSLTYLDSKEKHNNSIIAKLFK